MTRAATIARFWRLRQALPPGYRLLESGAARGERRYYTLEKPPHYALTTDRLPRIEAAVAAIKRKAQGKP